MSSVIIETPSLESAWLAGLGPSAVRTLLAWEQLRADALLADVFGYHALQVGGPALDSLRANRMPHRWTAKTEFESDGLPINLAGCIHEGLWMDSRAWPWPAESLDLVVMPHTLEQSADPHACLREVERVLIPEGQLFITGINPWSLWGWRQRRFVRQQRAAKPQCHEGQLISCSRLKDWLGLLGFEVQVIQFSGRVPAVQSERWRTRWAWLDRLGQRWWPNLGGAYLVVATKRVPGGRLLTSRPWRKVRSAASSTVPVARTDVSAGHPVP
jgi:SAM-dependent methyltransferase